MMDNEVNITTGEGKEKGAIIRNSLAGLVQLMCEINKVRDTQNGVLMVNTIMNYFHVNGIGYAFDAFLYFFKMRNIFTPERLFAFFGVIEENEYYPDWRDTAYINIMSAGEGRRRSSQYQSTLKYHSIYQNTSTALITMTA